MIEFMYTAYSKEEIIKNEKIIDDFFTQKGIVLYPRTEMVPLAMKLGFKVVAFNPDETIDGIILVENDKKYIGVNKRLSGEKLRFVVAHELGHYIYSLQLGQQDRVIALKDHIFHNEKKSELENLMDYYAAAILVPMKQFCDLKTEFKIDNYKTEKEVLKDVPYGVLTDLAKKFNVEVDTIVRRVIEASRYGN